MLSRQVWVGTLCADKQLLDILGQVSSAGPQLILLCSVKTPSDTGVPHSQGL